MLLLSLLFLVGLPVSPAAADSTALTGVLTQLDGAIQVVGPGVRGLPLASLWQIVRGGVTIRVPEGGSAGIVCSNRRFVRLKGPASWSLTEPACAAGKELTAGEYLLVAPQAGRFKVVSGLLTLEREMRGVNGDDPLAPLVLSPRNTEIRSRCPTISWTRVASAAEYQVEWSGRGTDGYAIRLDAGQVTCTMSREGIEICTLPWPANLIDLPPGEIFFLKLAARGGMVEPWHWSETVEVRTPKLTELLALESQARDLASLDIAGITLEVARAGLFAVNGFYAEAAETYRQVLADAPHPELRVTLADLYLAMGLHLIAEPLYREALANGSPEVRAAAIFGLGRIEYARRRYREAAAAFRQARELYGGQGLSEEEEAARQAAERAAARAPQ